FLDLDIQKLLQLHMRHLQQFDRLHQLGGHDQRLRLTEIELGRQSHMTRYSPRFTPWHRPENRFTLFGMRSSNFHEPPMQAEPNENWYEPCLSIQNARFSSKREISRGKTRFRPLAHRRHERQHESRTTARPRIDSN